MGSDINRFPPWFKAALAAVLLVFLSGGSWFYVVQEEEMAKRAENELAAIAALKAHRIAEWREDQLKDAASIMNYPSFSDKFLFPFINSLPATGKSAETLLLKQEGEYIRYLNSPGYSDKAPLEMKTPVSRESDLFVMAVLSGKGVVRGIDYRGVDAISAVEPVSGFPWFVAAKADADEAFADWHLRSMLILGFMLAAGLALAALGLVMWQKEKKTHYRTLYLSEAVHRESLERHRTTLRSIGDAVIVTDDDGRVEMLNPAAEILTGWTESEARTKPLGVIFNIVDEKTGQKAENPVTKVLRENTVVGLANHTLLIAKDGTKRPIADSGAPIRDQDGRITGVVLVFSDQSKERLALGMTEIRLDLIEYAAGHTLDELLTRALDEIGGIVDSPIGFYLFLSQDGQSITLQQWSTRTRNEFCSLEGQGFYYPLKEAGVWVDSARNGRPVVHNDYESLRQKKGLPEGHPFVIRELVVPVMRNNKAVAVLGVGNKPCDYTEKDMEVVSYLADVTWEIVERKKAEAGREQLLSAIEQTGEMIVITDTDGTIQYVNPAFEQITGYEKDEAIGQTPRILKSGRHDKEFYRDLWDTISGGDIWRGRIFNKRKDGTIYTEDATITPVLDNSGNIVNYVAVKHDITERLKLEDQLRQAQKMESVGRLAGGVAHDYNNMLSVIIGHSELAIDKTDPGDSVRSDLQEILNAGKRSSEITRQLLAFARKQDVSPVILDLNKTVEGMLKMLQRLIGEDIDIAWHPGASPGSVKIDPAQVDQLLANLCVNARDAIEGVGKLAIATFNAVFGRDYCARNIGFAPGRYVCLAVSDDGCGMDKATLENIFEPFFTTKDADRGTGLGLSTVYGIVKQNSGFINVYSEPGKGTTFRIYLPLHKGEQAGGQKQAEHEIPRGRGETILVAEDDASTLKMAQMALESLGYKVLTAATPAEALDLAKQHGEKIRLLVTDVIMPEMNGKELAGEIKSMYPGIRCLYMSGYTFDVITHRGVLDKNEILVQKPFSIRELAASVRKGLDAGN